MALNEDREAHLQFSTFDYINMRGLFYSQLQSDESINPKTGDFRDFEREHPRNLVTRSVFIDEFWSKPQLVPSKIKKSGLTAEQAWFGIRSIIKGSTAVFNYMKERKLFRKKLFLAREM